MMTNLFQISAESIGRNLKLLRMSCDVKQADMAELLGVSRSSYAQYELGNRIPDICMLYEIALYFQIGMEMLFEADQARFLAELALASAHGGESKKIIENYRCLSPFSKGRLLQFSEKLLEDDKVKENSLKILQEKRKAK